MTDVASSVETDPTRLVDEAAGWAIGLWKAAHRTIGDTQERSMHEAARLARVSPNTIWRLRYRKPADISVSIYNRLMVAHRQHVESAEATVAANLEILRSLPATPARTRLVAQMEEFLRDQEGAEVGRVASKVAQPVRPQVGGGA